MNVKLNTQGIVAFILSITFIILSILNYDRSIVSILIMVCMVTFAFIAAFIGLLVMIEEL